jgi:hypothetical protein
MTSTISKLIATTTAGRSDRRIAVDLSAQARWLDERIATADARKCPHCGCDGTTEDGDDVCMTCGGDGYVGLPASLSYAALRHSSLSSFPWRNDNARQARNGVRNSFILSKLRAAAGID